MTDFMEMNFFQKRRQISWNCHGHETVN